jgi:ATP-dependent DNA helicase RecG
MLSNEEILQQIADRENDRVERTISVSDTDKFAQVICAFSNDLANHKKPGYLFIGVHDKSCRLSGLKVTDELLRNISAIRSDGNVLPQPAMTVHCASFSEGDVLVVEVMPAHFPPVRYKGQIWVRIGPRKAIANEAEERFLIEKRTSQVKTFDEQPCIGASLRHIDIDLFKNRYLPRAIDRETIENDKRDIKFQLASLRFYDLVYDYPTNAGILMFGKDVRSHFPAAYVQFVKFAGTKVSSTVLADTQFSGNLITMIDDLNHFLKINIIVKRPVFVSILQEDNVYNFSERAIREFLMNALMHRSYEITSPIKFYQFSDRIEIINPGGLYGNARPENFPHVSDYRNLIIAESMRVMGFVNRFNRGIETSQSDLLANGNKPAKFELNTWGVFGVIVDEAVDEINIEKDIDDVTDDITNVTNNVTDVTDDVTDVTNNVTDDITNVTDDVTDVTNNVTDDVTDRIRNILDFITENNQITVLEIAKRLKVTKRTILRDIEKLKNNSLIERVGSGKSGHWKIK